MIEIKKKGDKFVIETLIGEDEIKHAISWLWAEDMEEPDGSDATEIDKKLSQFAIDLLCEKFGYKCEKYSSDRDKIILKKLDNKSKK